MTPTHLCIQTAGLLSPLGGEVERTELGRFTPHPARKAGPTSPTKGGGKRAMVMIVIV